MAQRNLPFAKAIPTDPPKMKVAITNLVREKIFVTRPSPYQLKIDDLNFYPTRGTIIRDGSTAALPQRGLDALLEVLGKARSPRLSDKAVQHERSRPAASDDEGQDPGPKVLRLADVVGVAASSA